MPPDFQGKVDHIFGFGDDFSFAGKSAEVMTRITVIALNGDSMFFADSVTIIRKDSGKAAKASQSSV